MAYIYSLLIGHRLILLALLPLEHYHYGAVYMAIAIVLNATVTSSTRTSTIIMEPSAAFTSPTSVSTFIKKSSSKRTSICAIATERPSDTKTEDKKRGDVKILPSNFDPKSLPKPPLHHSIPALGYLTESVLGLSTNATRARRLGPVYASNFLLQHSVYVTEMEAIMTISRDPETFTTVGSFEPFAVMFGEDNPIVQDGVPHMRARNLLVGSFSPALFPFYFDFIVRRIRLTWERAHHNVNENGRIKLDPVLREHYLSVIVEMTTGIDMESTEAADLRTKFLEVQKAFFSPMFGPVWNAGLRNRDILTKRLEAIIRDNLQHKAHIIEKLREYGDKLPQKGGKDISSGEVNVLLIAIANSELKTGDMHLNDPKIIADLTNLILVLWFAGYATSAATTACSALEIGMSEDIMAALVAEQDAMVSAAGDRELTYAQTNDMPLLDSFVSEILRLHPAAAVLTRKTLKNVSIFGHYVDAGTPILLDVSASMRDANVYEDPDTLKVDRFLRKDGHPPAAKLLSFGAPGSPHYCIGSALARTLVKSTLSVLLREYRLQLDPKQSTKYSIVPEETPDSKVVCIGLPRRE